MEFKNQFADVPKDEVVRSTLIVPYKIKSRYARLDPKEGVIQTTISILLTKLINELESTVDVSDRYSFQAAVAGCRIVLPATVDKSGSTVTKPTTRKQPAKSRKSID